MNIKLILKKAIAIRLVKLRLHNVFISLAPLIGGIWVQKAMEQILPVIHYKKATQPLSCNRQIPRSVIFYN